MLVSAHERRSAKIIAKYSRVKPKKKIRFRGGKVLIYNVSQHKTAAGVAYNKFLRLVYGRK